MRITIKDIIEILNEQVGNKNWKDFDSGFEIATIADFGNLRKEFENSLVLDHYLQKHNIDMVFDTIGTHFIKL